MVNVMKKSVAGFRGRVVGGVVLDRLVLKRGYRGLEWNEGRDGVTWNLGRFFWLRE